MKFVPKKKLRRGFSAMHPDKQRAIARKGGLTVSCDSHHMASIGCQGGKASGVTRRKRK